MRYASQIAFVPCNRNESALHVPFFCSGRYQSATHIAFFYAGNMPYASRLRMFFGRGLENPAGLRFIFGRGMENRVGIRLRFIQGMDFWVGIRFIRPLAWPPVRRMQYAPTRVPEKWRFFYPFDHRCGRLWGICCCALHGQTKTGLIFGSYFEGGRKRGRGVGCAKSGVGALP